MISLRGLPQRHLVCFLIVIRKSGDFNSTSLAELAAYSKKSTISSREIQTAVRLILPGELAKHAISEGTKSVTSECLFVLFFFFVGMCVDVCALQSFRQPVPSKRGLSLFFLLVVHQCIVFSLIYYPHVLRRVSYW